MVDLICLLPVFILVTGLLIGLFKFIVALYPSILKIGIINKLNQLSLSRTVEKFRRGKMGKDFIQEENAENNVQSKSEGLHTEQLLVETLKKIGCRPEKVNDDTLRFEYQGGIFQILFNDTSVYVTVRFLFWHDFSSYDIDRFSVMQKVVNEANAVTSGKVFYSVNKEDETVYLHSENTSLFIKEIPQKEDYLYGILQGLFRIRSYVYCEMEKAMCKEND